MTDSCHLSLAGIPSGLETLRSNSFSNPLSHPFTFVAAELAQGLRCPSLAGLPSPTPAPRAP